MSFTNYDQDGRPIQSDVLAFTPHRITAAAAGDIIVKNGPGVVAFLLVETADVTVSLIDGSQQVTSGLIGIDQDDWSRAPIQLGQTITLRFSAAGSCTVVCR